VPFGTALLQTRGFFERLPTPFDHSEAPEADALPAV
jgi:hypothetical protein